MADDAYGAALVAALSEVDEDNDGVVSPSEIKAALCATSFGLRLLPEEIDIILDGAARRQDGRVMITPFVRAHKLHMLAFLRERVELSYTGAWIHLYAAETGSVYVNKETGESQLDEPEDYTLNEDTIVAHAICFHFSSRDENSSGMIDYDTFCIDLQGHELGLYLQPNEVEAVVLAATDNEPTEYIDYRTWAIYARQAIMSIYSERPPHPSEWAYIDTNMYGRVWLNKASGVILDRVPLGLMAGIHSPEVLPLNALGQDVDAEDIQDMEEAREAIRRLKMELQGARQRMAALESGSETLSRRYYGGGSTVVESRPPSQGIRPMSSNLRQASAVSISRGHRNNDANEAAGPPPSAARDKHADAESRKAIQKLRDSNASLLADVTKYKRQLQALQESSQDADPLQQQVDKLRRDLTEVRHLSEERQKQIYALKQQLQKAHQRLDESSSTDSTMLRLKEELATEREAVRTVKTFLTTKTKMVADKNAQIKDLEHQVALLSQMDERREKALGDLLHRSLPADAWQTAKSENQRRRSQGLTGSPNTISGNGSRRNSIAALPPISPQSSFDMRESESVAASHLRVGDRVRVTLPGRGGGKAVGQIKYVGFLDNSTLDLTLYAGIRLDEPISDMDGIHKGKRYFTCPPDHGVIVKAADVTALSPKKGSLSGPSSSLRSPVGSPTYTV